MRPARALAAPLVLLAACTIGGPVDTAPPATTSTTAPTPRAGGSAEDAVDLVAARRLLTEVDAAAEAGPGPLREAAAGLLVAESSGLVTDRWRDTVLELLPGWPVVVGEASLALDGSVDLDVVVAVPPDPDGELVLRWLPAAPALGEAVAALDVTVDGRPVDVELDAAGARLLVPVEVEVPAVVRVRSRYRVPAREDVVDDGTPAGYGLLSRTDTTVMLGHWLPLVALPGDDGPMQARGDVGAFPPAVFSIVVHHDGQVVSGGEEGDCPGRPGGCTWLQGVGLRDLAAVVLAEGESVARGRATVHVAAGSPAAARAADVAEEAEDTLTVLTVELGGLPWPTVDVVTAPISPGAAGMEFPGLVWIDDGAWPEQGPDFGSYVLAHELGHQWFHALVGNGSMSAPVVDESVAQYLSVVVFDVLFGPGEGAALASRSMAGRHSAALADGVPDEAPAQPLESFESARSYGANVYGRGGQAWVDAEQAAGRDAVLVALRTLVSRYGLREVDAPTVLDVMREVAPDAAPALAEGWGLDG